MLLGPAGAPSALVCFFLPGSIYRVRQHMFLTRTWQCGIAGAGAYYFAKKSINADRAQRFEETQRKKRMMDSLERPDNVPTNPAPPSNDAPVSNDVARLAESGGELRSRANTACSYDRGPKGFREKQIRKQYTLSKSEGRSLLLRLLCCICEKVRRL